MPATSATATSVTAPTPFVTVDNTFDAFMGLTFRMDYRALSMVMRGAYGCHRSGLPVTYEFVRVQMACTSDDAPLRVQSTGETDVHAVCVYH